MLHPLRAAARFIDQKIGWNRIGLILSLVIIAAAATVLYRMLRGIQFAEVMVALKATEISDVLLAGLFVALGYFTLTFYDLFALRAIGANHVPYRVAATAGFTSYSIGHNVGASVFTGGAVRYRVYSAWGLTAIDVAKICFIAGLTFLLGFASSSPGGLGVFDAAMLVALIEFDKEHLVAGLLLFRLLYYVIPFALSLVILGIRELWLGVAPKPHT